MLQTERLVLYVDDTIEQRYVMRRILEREGYRVLEAGTGQEALDLLRPELMLIVLDVKLPDMSGYDVCRRIKGSPLYRSIPIIQVSASFADPELRAAGLSGGADAYIAQPVHPQELLNLVSSLIRSTHADRMLSFLAQFGPAITRSLELQETLAAIQRAVTPYFADRAMLRLELQELADAEMAPFDPELQRFADDVLASGQAQLWAGGSKALSVAGARLQVGSTRLGVLLLILEKGDRQFEPNDLVYAEDLAYRIALAVQNSRLFTSQRQAQEALVQAEKLNAAARLSAAIAHELNNPLASITNLIYLIETHANVPPEVRDYAREALSEIQRLSHITRQTLGFYRELTTAELFDLTGTVQGTLDLYARRFSAKEIRIETQYQSGLMMYAVRGEIRQVISNLLVNALDALPHAGHLHLKTWASGVDAVALSIRDNGSGIARSILGRIFEPFFTTKKGTGTGLGLWVSETLVRKHGGEITVETSDSGDQQGTTFTVILPTSSLTPLED